MDEDAWSRTPLPASAAIESDPVYRETGGNFYELRHWSDADWLAARERIEAQNQKDKAQR